MKKNCEQLTKSTLFSSIAKEDIEKIMDCISPRVLKLKRGEFVFRAGESIHYVYFILSGRLHIVDEDFLGNSSIVETLRTGVLFGEAYVFSSIQTYLVGVAAAENSVILQMDPKKLFETCSNGCECHEQLVKNAVRICSEKIVRLTAKLGHVMHRTLREKLLSYLTKCAQLEGTNSFDIPYSRQELADYLCADRSAVSHELSRMQRLGLIRYRKNHFKLLTEHKTTV